MNKKNKIFFILLFALIVQFNFANINAQATYSIKTLADWNTFANDSPKISNATINIENDIDFTNYKEIEYVFINPGVTLNGNGHTFSNIKLSKYFITKNRGMISNLKFDKVTINGPAKEMFIGIVRVNYGFMEKITVTNSKFKGHEYVGIVSRNFGSMNIITGKNITVTANRYSGAVAGMNTSALTPTGKKEKVSAVGTTRIYNVSLEDIVVQSTLKAANKSYRNAVISGKKDCTGDFLGGAIGANAEAFAKNIKVNKVRVYGDDFVGGVFGGVLGGNKNAVQKSIADKITATNVTVYGGTKVGGLVAYVGDYQKINLNRISPYKKNHTKIQAILANSTLSGNVTINGATEVGGAVGYNLSGKISNVVAKGSNVKKFNVTAYGEEAGGLVADNEFGYVESSRTNLNVKSKIQAGGFVADNEGSIIKSISTGKVHTSRDAGGFIGSNMGIIINCKAYGDVNTTLAAGGKKRPVNSGNFAGYNHNGTYKGVKLKGTIKKSKGYGDRFLKGKKLPYQANGGYGK